MAFADPIEVLEPTPSAIRAARQSRESLTEVAERLGSGSQAGTVRLHDLDLPVPVLRLLVRVLDELADGHTVEVRALTEPDEQITTSRAARLLGMSRPTLIGLLDREEIPYRRVGTHRRIPLGQVLAYRERMARGNPAGQPSRAERLRGLEEMAEYTDRLGLGY